LLLESALHRLQHAPVRRVADEVAQL